MRTKLLKIGQIKVDEERFYPRFKYSWQTAYDYSESMKAGQRFPPIVVALFKGKYFLVDGRHRLEACRINKEKHVQVDILRNKTGEQIYLEAIKRNINHGRAFSMQEKVGIIKRLKDVRYNLGEISKIVHIPVGKIKQFAVTRITNSLSGGEVILKAPMEHLAGTIVPDNFEKIQEKLMTNSQVGLLDQMIDLLENDVVDTRDKEVTKRLEKLAILLNRLVKPVKKTKRIKKKK